MSITLGLYKAKWFSSVDWATQEAELLAENEDQVRAKVDELCAPEFRTRPAMTEGGVDSLKISRDGDVTIPFILSGPC